ncbi:TPA: inverse autotransporter beta-barrel domain-containing protein [Escherichia coli]|uniref:inverse autotransporter beta domain-containing protein n=1 Tax=Escherichia coli TaxID=562 RepID=UPI00020DF693|nr:inverse autotransporter beta-barrel domain-containing protein [Escherichia coli]EFN7279637.1 inverse autotransporter beta-barrel domain-containing protein [Escherichia coli O11:H5]EEW2613718.1 inverse autotransporter beta-barrel domain-containing protein [Escherichia coli]EEY5889953.1 inverse autotransporter beta-barrel domain-containing protein [Escherichia coli]EEZ6655099.1 inverse autotransporter beta-barrel domain-containing protein [Escherichia coli]EFF1824984.1 inverse autotransporter
MTTVNKKLKKTASGAITWSVIVTQILSPVSLSLIPANSFASSGNKDVTQIYASDEHANKVASFAASAGQSLANNNASSFAVNTLSTQATKEVVDWLQQYGNARIKLNVDDSFSLKDSSFDFLYPWLDTQDYVLFSQTSLHRTDDRNQTNIGLGIRHFTPDNAMLGANVFYDYDLSRSHSRAGFGVEYWRDYFRLGVNTYFGLSDWKNSRDIDDYLERPANGWDFSAEGWLPAYPQLGASIQFEKYYGKNVGLFGSDNLQENPYAVTGGISYTPVPLIKFSAQHKQGQSNTHDTTFGVEFNYRPGVSLAEQLSSDNVAVMREVQNRRYDFVERNNNIVLEYKKKHALKISLPESVQGEGESIIPVTLTINNASGGIKSVQWNDSAFTAAGGKISGNGTSWQITLPAYKSEGVNSWNVGATVQDNRGNVSNYAVMNISVTDSGVSTADSSFTLDGDSSPTISADSQSTYPIVLSLKDSNGKALTGLADDIEMSVEFTADSNSARQRETVTAPSLGAVEEISAGVYRSVLTAGSQAGTVRVTAKVQGKTFTLNIKQAAITDSDVSTADSSFTLDGDSSPTISADSQSTYPIVLSLKDSNGKALTGLADDIEMSVEFTADSNSARQRETVTAPSLGAVEEISAGVYRSVLAAGSQAGTVRVTAKVQGKTFTLSIKQTAATEPDSEVSAVLTAAPAEQVVGYNINLQLAVKDSQGNAITGDNTLSFYALNQAEGVEFGTVTEKDGVYSATVTSKRAGKITIGVKSDSHDFSGVKKEITFIEDRQQVTFSQFEASQNNALADGKQRNMVTVSLADRFGNVVPGYAVTLSLPAGITQVGGEHAVSTDENGNAIFALISSTPGSYVITAHAGSQMSTELTVTFASNMTGASLSLTPESSSLISNIPANGKDAAVLDVQLTNTNASVNGQKIQLITSSEGLSVPTNIVTDSTGHVSVPLTTVKAGEYTVTARVTDGSHSVESGSVKLTFVPDVASAELNMSVSKQEIVADGSENATVNIQLVDANNNAFTGEVDLTITPSTGASLTSSNLQLDAHGQATTQFTASKSGQYTIQAEYVLDGKRITASQNIDAVTDVKGAVLEITSSASSAVVSDTNNLVFTLLLKSKSGEALSGRALNVKTSGPSKYGALVVDKTTVTTDENGQATVSVHGRTVGSYKLTATLNELGSDVSAVKSFSLYADDANGVLTLTKDPGYETNDGSPVGIYARFVDHFGNPLSGTVEFSAGSEDSPDSQRVKMEPATVTLHWTGNAASEFSTYESGYHWIKAKITNSKNTYEKTIRTYVVKLPEKDS